MTEIAEKEAKTSGNKTSFAEVANEITAASKIKKTNFDEDYKKVLEQRARDAGDKDSKIELPKSEYEAGSENYLKELRRIAQQLEKNTQDIEIVNVRVDLVEIRVTRLEDRMDILDGKVLGLEHSMYVVDESINRIDSEIQKNQGNQALLQDLTIERNKASGRKNLIKEFNKNPDLADYYHNALSEITAFYIAAQAIATERVSQEKSGTYEKAAGFLNLAAKMVPVVGHLAAKLTSFVGRAVDAHKNVTEKQNLIRLRDLSPTIQEFDEIALIVAVELTSKNKDKITSLKQAKIPKDWKRYLDFDTLTSVEHFLTKYLEEDKSQAGLLGKTNAHDVIEYLQQPRVAENLRFEEEKNRGSRNYQRKESVIADEIIKNLPSAASAASEKPSSGWGNSAQASASVGFAGQITQNQPSQPRPPSSQNRNSTTEATSLSSQKGKNSCCEIS
jgi:hypothetical protein